MKKFFLSILLLSYILFCVSCTSSEPLKKNYGVFIGSTEEDIEKMYDYDVLVIDADLFSSSAIARLHEQGNHKIYSYLNIGAIENFRPYYKEFESILLDVYEDWPEERWVDVSQTSWNEHLYEKAKEFSYKGVDGFFLDNADVYYQYPSENIYQGLLDILHRLDTLSLPLIMNGGDFFVSSAIERKDLDNNLLYGVNQETVFTSIDFNTGSFAIQTIEETNYFQRYLKMCKSNGLQVYLTEYGRDKKIEGKIASYCSQNGFFYYYSPTLELLAP